MAPARTEETKQKSEFYTTSEAAEKLGVSTKTIQNWTNNGNLPTQTTKGRHRRILKEVVDKISHHEYERYKKLKCWLVENIDLILKDIEQFSKNGKNDFTPKHVLKLREKKDSLIYFKELIENDQIQVFHMDEIRSCGFSSSNQIECLIDLRDKFKRIVCDE